MRSDYHGFFTQIAKQGTTVIFRADNAGAVYHRVDCNNGYVGTWKDGQPQREPCFYSKKQEDFVMKVVAKG